MSKSTIWVYRIVTGLFSLLIGMGAGMYFFDYETVAGMYNKMGFPTFIIYPLAVAKILGLVAIWTNKSKTLKEWAYAGFVFELLLAIGAHLNISDGEHWGAVVALILVSTSYFFNKKLHD